MGTTITILEFILITAGSLLAFALMNATVETIKDKLNDK
jgi:hypothetical protein